MTGSYLAILSCRIHKSWRQRAKEFGRIEYI